MKTTIIGLSRYEYTKEQTGELKSGCVVHYLDLVEENSNQCGYREGRFITKYSLYETLYQVWKENKPVTLDVTYSRLNNGNYKMIVHKINDIVIS